MESSEVFKSVIMSICLQIAVDLSSLLVLFLFRYFKSSIGYKEPHQSALTFHSKCDNLAFLFLNSSLIS